MIGANDAENGILLTGRNGNLLTFNCMIIVIIINFILLIYIFINLLL